MTSMRNLTERELLVKIRKGDRGAFDEIYERYYARLRNYTLSFVKVKAYTEDIVQDTFLKLWEIRENINVDKSFPAYVFTIIRNLIFKFLKSAAHNTDVLTDIIISSVITEPDAPELVEVKELRSEIQHAIDLLPPRRREIFLLSRDEHLSYKEIAEQLGISINTVKDHMVLAMRFIRDHVTKYSLYLSAALLLMSFHSEIFF